MSKAASGNTSSLTTGDGFNNYGFITSLVPELGYGIVKYCAIQHSHLS